MTTRTNKTPALMFLGTCSDAGKSILTAAFCRILLQDGFSAAPFKAQNMSLNSYVTHDGLEMGRAQVVQAQACRLDPDVRMNPVLLKPSSDVGSQIIVNGRPVGNMNVADYVAFKPLARQAAREAYDSLAAEYDVIVLEGAGSPAEINIKQHDFVNMAMAAYAEAAAILVGDIDRGGVFASLVGTMELLDEREKKRVAGHIINRFRGDAALLKDGLDFILQKTGKPVFGVVPYIHNLGLPEEDSVNFKRGLYEQMKPTGEYIEIGLIDLDHISNFTDVEPLLLEPDVYLRVIRSADQLRQARRNLDALILPGSKNVVADLASLRQSGIADLLLEIAAAERVEIIGICGGFQMLGSAISDPHRIESAGQNIEALNLLPLNTVLDRDKTLTRIKAMHLQSGCDIVGYEIHHGRTETNMPPVLRLPDGSTTGACSPEEHIWGSYLHGLFETDEFRRWFIDRLRQRRGLAPVGRILATYDLEPAFDRLAEVVRHSVDISGIYRQLGLQ